MDQTTVLSILKAGCNVYLTGSAGTGKTYLINQYITYLRHREVPVAITASTGIAATHIGGQTIHSWSGLGIRERVSQKDFDQIAKNAQTVARLKSVQVLIIDEISMLSGTVLTAINDILKHFRKRAEPFGGVQLILSGDFFQLPPVSRDRLSNREKFAFMAPVWVEAQMRVCYLTEQYRQQENILSALLAGIRSRTISTESQKLLELKLNSGSPQTNVLHLYTHNADVDGMNAQCLAANRNPSEIFEAETKGKAKVVESLKQSVLASPTLELKLDAKVIFVRNNPDRGYHNGTLGEVCGFDPEDGWPIVRTTSGRKITCQPEEWTVTDEKDIILAAYRQVPLRLAWAITVHKSQGMTLDEAVIDLSKTFEPGQGYVALSRLKSWDGLFLRGWNNSSLDVDPLAFKADVRFQELSGENDRWIGSIPEGELARRIQDFILGCGGTNDPQSIAENRKREKRYFKKEKKESTYARTLRLIEAKKTLDEIAFERDLVLGTIISHFQYLRKENPDIDLDIYRPDTKVIQKVEKVMASLKVQAEETHFDKNGDVRIGAIYSALNGKMDYETIRLARLFCGTSD